MRSQARFKLLVDYGSHLGALVRRVDPTSMLHPVAYVIDLDDPFGLVWATAIRRRFGRPDIKGCLALARCSVPPGRAIATGCAPRADLVKLAAGIVAGMERRGAPEAMLVELVEVEIRIGRPPAPRAFGVLVVTDQGAEVAAERLDPPIGRA